MWYRYVNSGTIPEAWQLTIYAEVEIRFLICQDKPARQFEFWLDISRIWLDKFRGPIMIIITRYTYMQEMPHAQRTDEGGTYCMGPADL